MFILLQWQSIVYNEILNVVCANPLSRVEMNNPYTVDKINRTIIFTLTITLLVKKQAKSFINIYNFLIIIFA